MTTFNFTFEPGVTVQQALGFEMAGRIWSSYLSDPVTLNIHVGISSALPARVIGGALPGILANASYGSVVNAGLRQDQKSNDDRLAYSRIFNTGDAFSAVYEVPLIIGSQKLAIASNTMNLTRANAKAIGAISPHDSALDAAIVLGSLAGSSFSWNYDYTRSSSAPRGSLDFLSVALHEIGHVLGFISGVDAPGWDFSRLDTRSIPPELQQLLQQRTALATPLDLLRSSLSSKIRGTNDLSYGNKSGDKFLTLDRDDKLGELSTGKSTTAGGDGYQASHWEERSLIPLGIMDPALGTRERLSISNLDLRVFDAIGWDLRNGLSAGTLTTSFLTTIRDQAIQALAQRLGQSPSWVTSNLNSLPASLLRDRTADVDEMARRSEVYSAGRKGSGSGTTTSRSWMETYNQMASNQEVYINFDMVSDADFTSLSQNAITPSSLKAGLEGTIPKNPVLTAGTKGSGSGGTTPRGWRGEISADSLLGSQTTVGVSTPLSVHSTDALTHYQPSSLPSTELSNRSGRSSQFHSDEQPHRRRRSSNSLRTRVPKVDFTQADFGEVHFSKRRQQKKTSTLVQSIEGTPQRLLTPNSFKTSEDDRPSLTSLFWKCRELGESISQPSAVTSADNPLLERLSHFVWEAAI